jgi:predicted pyridoxine 5'-phosphate oxidase superfamily flavin-nucleotide-binding protein
MSYGFLDIAATPSIKAAWRANGVEALWSDPGLDRPSDRFTAAEAQFIRERDSFYIASASETGWPYVQHRGGPVGFLKVLDDRSLAFADFRGNRQYISLGNLSADDRVALILMDYANRRRLKIYGRVSFVDLATDPALAARVSTPGYRGKAERAALIRLEAFDWNCAQHITPRFTTEEIGQALAPERARLARLEAENRELRARLDLPGAPT